MGTSGDDFTDYVGRVVDAERVAQRLSVDELAALSGVPKRSLYRILGADRNIKIGPLMQVAAALGMKPSQVFLEAERRMSQAPHVEQVLANAPELTERQKQAIRDQSHPDNDVTHPGDTRTDDDRRVNGA